MELFEIKYRWTGALLFSLEAGSLRLALEAAVKADANLRGANLRGADLGGADLRGADLRGANLRGAHLGIEVPVLPHLDQQILAAIEAGGTLNMATWHTCQTTHCRAGWAIHLAGAPGKALEARLGPSTAGALIYQASAGYVPHFYGTNEDALADIRVHAAATSSAVKE
jgi:hypothetical protein